MDRNYKTSARMCWIKMSWLSVFTIAHLFAFHIAKCENINDTYTRLEIPEEKEDEDHFTTAMEPLYEMTVNWLEVVQPSTKGSILEVLNFKDALLDEDDESKEKSERPFDINEDWDVLVTHYRGYAVLFAFSAAFLVLMPLVGLIFCCCRCCCGRCGGKTRPHQGKSDKCCRVVCGFVLFCLNTCMLAAVICAFFTNELLRQQTAADEDDAVLQTLVTNIDRVTHFRDDVISDVNVEVLDVFESWVDDKTAILMDLPDDIKEGFADITGATEAIQAAKDVARSAERINTYLNYTQVRSATLQSLQDRLDSELADVKQDLANALDPCSGDTECQDLLDDINALQRQANYYELDNITAQRLVIEEVITNDLLVKITEGEANLDEVSEEVSNETASEVSNVTRELKEAVEKLEKQIKKYEEEIKAATKFEKRKKDMVKAEDDVENFGNYRYYAGIAIACVLLLVILLLYLGLLFGVFGSAPDDYEEKTCTSATGADFLMAGIGFMFIFSTVLMFICMLLFLLGGVTYTEVCRYLIDDKALENSDALRELDNILEGLSSNDSNELDLSISDILSGCKKNKAIYTVVNLDKVFNLTKYLDIAEYGIEDSLDRLSDVPYSLSGNDIYTDEMKTELEKLKNAGLNHIDFNSMRTVLDTDLTNHDLVGLAVAVETFANQLASGARKTDLMQGATRLRDIAGSTVVQITDEVNNLHIVLNSLETEVTASGTSYPDHISNLMDQLEAAETSTREDTVNKVTNLVTEFTDEFLEDVIRLLGRLVDTLHNDIAKCEPVYVIMDTTIDSVCHNVLDPWNGFWFALGWCLIFFIPCIVVAAVLSSLYRTPFVSYRNHGDGGKDFEDANYDLYTGTHDNIPLQERKQRNGHYNQNTGYEHDYTASRSANYRADSHYPGAYPNAPPHSPPHYGNNRSRNKFQY